MNGFQCLSVSVTDNGEAVPDGGIHLDRKKVITHNLHIHLLKKKNVMWSI